MIVLTWREREGLLHVLEVEPTTVGRRLPKADVSRTVKSYSRCAAGQEMPAARDLRPPLVLRKTLQYLLNSVVTDSRYDWCVVYEFVFDRLRAIRQDMVMQGVCPTMSISLLQPMVRFHAYAAYRLCEVPLAKFDPQINRTHLLECLKTLLTLYDEEDGTRACMCSSCVASELTNVDGRTDSSKDSSPSGESTRELLGVRVETEALYLALNLGSAPAIGRTLELGFHKSNPVLDVALNMSLSHWLGHYVTVCRNLPQLPPIVLCIASLHLPAIRRQALRVMSVAYSSRNLGYPLSRLTALLLYSSDAEAAGDCRRYNLPVKEGSVFFDKKLYNAAAVSVSPLQHEPFVERKLQDCDLPQLLLGM